ncbi:phosphoribosylanthranilate isomerase [Sphingoaurantiacus capsulatus]|uniref:N-(5'-phosphoribosyl)anthranilate isomerase n=1 Tax=Sphingoaurantiacus capsulatus TaxID=1771310 RepID=A0ABV7X8G0_9SPHN
MTQVKICGLSEPATLDAAVAAGADYVGFVFFAKSPRNVSLEQAAALAARVPDRVGRVGVFVDADEALLGGAIHAGRLTAIQLHGADPAQAAAARRRLGIEVWAALPVATRADIERAGAFRGAADRLLFDAKAPKGADLPGGNALRFDWRLLDGVAMTMPWGLAGGLDAGNVAEACRATGAPLVDVSSGVEDAPGIKSADRIRAFVKAVRER